MALQIVTGHIYENKKSHLIKRLLEIKQQDPSAIIYYLVPEHIKFDMEKYMLEEIQNIQQTEHSAMIDIQVVSFTRLSWFLLQEQNQHRLSLSDIGVTMLIKQLLERHKTSLIVYQGQDRHLGFIEKLRALFEELYQGNITPDAFSASDIEKLTSDSELMDLEEQRLNELKLLYTDFCHVIREKSLTNYQAFQDLGHYFSTVSTLPHHYIVIDHHYFFNAQQFQLITDLVQRFNTVWITLPLTHREAVSTKWQPLIQVAQETYKQLKHLSRLFNFEIEIDWDISNSPHQYKSEILSVAKQFNQQLTQIKTSERRLSTAHDIWQFETPQSELRHLSNQIHYLVTKEGYRYQDILVVTRDMDRYQQMIGPYFEMNDIPYFYDHESTMGQHPLVLWLEAYFNLEIYHWRYQDIMMVIKSDLFNPDWLKNNRNEARHQKNIFENILIANGYFGYRFYSQNFSWDFPNGEQPYVNYEGQVTDFTVAQIIDQWREWMIETLYHPLKSWVNFSGKMASEWLYHLLQSIGIQEELISLRDAAVETGKIELSRKLEQVWQVLMNTLDEFYLMYEDECIDFDLFTELLIAGISQATYHIIPPTMDQVTVTSMESPRVKPNKICFVLGADDATLPKTYVTDSLLSEDNRKKMKERLLAHQYLASSAQLRNQLEALIGYQVLLNATEHLYIFYAVNVEGQTRKLSQYFAPFVKDGVISLEQFEGNSFVTSHVHTSQIGKVEMQLSPLLTQLRASYLLGQPLNIELYVALHQVLSHPKAKENNWNRLLQRMFKFHALPENLNSETAIQLFGKNLSASVSKIEQFYHDPFSHYLTYGLRLKEREQYQIDAAKTGDYFHSALDVLMHDIINDGHTLRELDSPEIRTYLDSAIHKINKEWKFNLFDSHPRMRVIRAQLDQQLWRFIRFSHLQQTKTLLQTIQTEALFGSSTDQSLHGFHYNLSSGGKLYLTGKIDRIDQVIGQNKLQIIDYKSGNKQFNLSDAYYGHDLQILTYLKVALDNYSGSSAIGAFYQPLIQGYQIATPEILQQLEANESLEYQLSDNLLRGFITMTPEELVQIEPDFEESGKSLIYPAKRKKDGSFDSYSAYLDTNELQLLLKMIDQRFKQAGEQIQKGNIALQPYKDYPYTTSLMSGYRVISGFDATEHYHLYRNKTLKSKEVIERLREEVEQDD